MLSIFSEGFFCRLSLISFFIGVAVTNHAIETYSTCRILHTFNIVIVFVVQQIVILYLISLCYFVTEVIAFLSTKSHWVVQVYWTGHGLFCDGPFGFSISPNDVIHSYL